MANKNEQILEAIERLSKFDFHPNVLKEFKDDCTIYYSERSSMGGILYWLRNNPEWEKKVREFEEKYNALVYHITHENTAFGECLTLLYVSNYKEEWEYDMELLETEDKNRCAEPIAYVMNLTYPECSEFGTVGVKAAGGGLMRMF